MKTSLPIDAYLPKIIEMIAENPYTLIKASAGSGKTTRIPPQLLTVTNQKILILVPRKLVAKMLALRISEELGSEIGSRVGYLFRGERAYSDKTQLLFITEGTLLRLLENDPLLEAFAFVFLDEFHERHLETDLAFYHLQKVNQKRVEKNLPLLKLIFMSATLNTDLLKKNLPHINEFNLEIPPFERTVYYLPNTPSILKIPLPIKVKNALLDKTPIETKGVLVFVAGKKEIQEVLETLKSDEKILALYELAILHGELTKDEQQFALMPPSGSKKKIVIATNIAESSLTIPYINMVIDSGLEREYQGHVTTGFGKLITKKIDRASAEQRAGRSNRTGPGVVFRLYSQIDFEQRSEFKVPAILRAPLSEPILSILKNHQILETTIFLEEPPAYHLEMGYKQLQFLNYINSDKVLHESGKKFDPLFGLRLSLVAEAFSHSKNISIKELIMALREFIPQEIKRDFENALSKIKTLENSRKTISELDELIAHGFLDLTGSFSHDQKFILQNGETFIVHDIVYEKLGRPKFGDLGILLAMGANEEVTAVLPIEAKTILKFDKFLNTELITTINPNGKKKITTKTKLGLLTLKESHHYEDQSNEDKKFQLKNLLDNLTRDFFSSPDFIRFNFFQKFFSLNTIESYDPTLLIDIYLLEWSELEVVSEFHQNEFLQELKEELLQFLNADFAKNFDELFPVKMNFTDKRDTLLHYEIQGVEYIVFVESYMQDFYGLSTGPSIADGKLMLTFKLLGPHKRALQVTKDLNSFWTKTYKEMHKELNREYPRHHWPENPMSAKPVLLKRMLS